jgi:hypothetical protein
MYFLLALLSEISVAYIFNKKACSTRYKWAIVLDIQYYTVGSNNEQDLTEK